MRQRLSDIARELGVSTATVSNALNDRGRVSEETKRKIYAKAGELGYRPSHLGRALRTGRSGVLGLVLPDISNPLFPAIAQAVEAAAATAGYGVLIADSHGDGTAQAQALERMVARGADAIIVVPRRGTTVPKLTVPMAVVDTATTPGNSVCADHRTGGTQAVAHLQGLGHRQFLFLGESPCSLVQSDRVAGMVDGLGPGAAHRVIWLEAETPDYAQLIAAGATALIATSDSLALSALTQIQQVGFAVPRDISVMGFDNLSFGAIISPGLTTMAQDTHTIATCAVDHVTAQLDGHTPHGGTVIPMTLVVRESTARAPDHIPTGERRHA